MTLDNRNNETPEQREIRYAYFLAGLTELTRRYGIEIVGCGCCGSPSLAETKDPGKYVNDEQAYGAELKYVTED